MSQFKEQIILAPGANQSELLKSLAKFGDFSFNKRIVGSVELAQLALEDNGLFIKETFISSSNAAFPIYSTIKNLNKNYQNYTYSDCLDLLESIHNLRFYITDINEEEAFESKLISTRFNNKNADLRFIFSKYLSELKKDNLIDDIQTIRRAIELGVKLSNADIYCLKEFPLKPLERSLIDVVSGGKFKEISLCKDDKKINITSYTKSFGESNEVEHIFNYIYSHNINFDECLIASLNSSTYPKLFKNYCDVLGVNLKSGLNYSILETNPGKLFDALLTWEEKYHNSYYLKEILFNRYFDSVKFLKCIGFDGDFDDFNQYLSRNEKITLDNILNTFANFSFSFDKQENDLKLSEYQKIIDEQIEDDQIKVEYNAERIIFDYVKKIADIFSAGRIEFIQEFSYINPLNKVGDKNALGHILNVLRLADLYKVPFADIKKYILKINVNSESSKEGCLYICDLQKAMSVVRPYVFIVGLSSVYFPGSPKENPFLLDDDYEDFDVKEASNIDVVNNIFKFKSYIRFINFFAKEIHLSYSFFNTQSLKEQNGSSVLLDIYKMENGEDKTLSNFDEEFKNHSEKYLITEYFENNVSPTDLIGAAFSNNKKLIYEPVNNVPLDSNVFDFSSKAFSASAIEDYLKCEYKFFLKHIIGLKEDEQEDIYSVMSSIEIGNLAHSLLSKLNKQSNSPEEKEEFLKVVNLELNKFFVKNPTENETLKEKAITDFIEMMSNAFDMESNDKVFSSEKEIFATHESGILIHGIPDKVIMGKSGNVAVDYKTGASVKHFRNDYDSLIQLIMYSYLLKSQKENPIEISGFEYRYIKLKEKISCNNMDECYENLNTVLSNLKTSISTGSFSHSKECSYCRLAKYCKRRSK